MHRLLDQLYKTKLQLIAVIAVVAGIALLLLAKWPPLVTWLQTLPVPIPLGELGNTIFATGLLAVFFEYVDRKHGDQRTDERIRAAVRKEAPAIRDAVLDSFAFNADALKDVASPETLDRIATNALGLRLDDHTLAANAYTDLRDQVIRSPERWRNVDVSVSLSPWASGPAAGKGSMFVATVRWEYRVKPANAIIRFACVSSQAEYRDLMHDPSVASAWHFDHSGGIDPASREVFELVQLSINGTDRTIRRAKRQGSQLYTVNLGKAATTGDEVTIAYTYRVLAQRHSHLLYLDVPRPTKGFHAQLDYTHAGIRKVNTLDYFASPKRARVEESPASTPTKTIDIGFDDWIFPRAGVAFVWVLVDELVPSADAPLPS